jgi:hypothetical protein
MRPMGKTFLTLIFQTLGKGLTGSQRFSQQPQFLTTILEFLVDQKE